MRITMGRRSRLAALGAGVAAAITVAATAAGPALAGTTDTSGTASITVSGRYVLSLAKTGVVIFASGAGSSTWNNSAVSYDWPVAGGNGEISNFYGVVDLGGKLRVVSAMNGKTVIFTSLIFSFNTGIISGKPAGTSSRIPLADIGGDLSTDSSAGPPATETFTCDGLTLDGAGARYLDSALKTTAFSAGATLGGFTTTYTVVTS